MNRIHSLSTYFRRKYKYRIQKLPLDAGLTCPNRDGTVAFNGCTFCDTKGSGTNLSKTIPSLESQALHWQWHYNKKNTKYIAYLQSFSNTHCSHATLKKILHQCMNIKELIGFSIGTRADCLDDEKLDIIASLPYPEKWLEIGVQSTRNDTLQRINRGHNYEIVEHYVEKASKKGILLCLHLMAGLPGESIEDFVTSVKQCSTLPIHALKLHNVFVPPNTALEQDYISGKYIPLTEDEYITCLLESLPHIPSSIIIQRLTGDAEEGNLVAPLWSLNKNYLTLRIENELRSNNLWQGCKIDAQNSLPTWYTSKENLPKDLQDIYLEQCQELFKREKWLTYNNA
ncbi:MAG: TIGR01212 family radical SAM protein [Desulfovibrionaceae bacterium]